ncbi:MAG: competence/damage-inducible protein A [Haliscomenobacter sp.]|nr:competence/damage-inducible protein A [Haliscomenobacter sp.]MBK9487688.1 competence/damage-inducible protein A [Haliscomenobacter sp.]
MKISILTVGDEILIGQIVDTNSAWMGQQLNLTGARVVTIITVGDTMEAIHAGLREALEQADVILMTGGLGPTKDDITKKALSEYMGVDMVFHELTFQRITKMFEVWGRPMNEAHRLQCYMPANAEILTNKMGTAPGMWMEYAGKVIVSMPGVPYEMQYLMEHEVLPKLKQKFQGQPIAHRTILTVGEGESHISEKLEDFEEGLPEGFKLAYLPQIAQVRLRITGSLADEATLHRILDEKAEIIKSRFADIIYGFGTDTLEGAIGVMLKERGLKLATAESCTGGYLAHRITSVAGASDYFVGSVIAYANEVKMQVLGVSSATLDTHGAVSEQTVIEMAEGAVKVLPADIAISISGIAGPGGGSDTKPVGLAWMAVSNGQKTKTFSIRAGKDRDKNIQYFTIHALNQIRRFLLECV